MGRHSRARQDKRSDPTALLTATNEPDIHPDATLGPEASSESTMARWMGPESTTAPLASQPSPEPLAAASGVGLLERFLGGRLALRPRSVFLVLTIGWFAIVSWLFVKDNELGRLTDEGGLRWFGVKALIYSGFYLLVALVVGIASRFRRNEDLGSQ